jgi:thioredoxin-like negative regulator of GroEL
MNCLRNICLTFACLLYGASTASAQLPWSKGEDAAKKTVQVGAITWQTDLTTALKIAREQRKLVLIHFSGDHCAPCRSFEDKVLSRNEVALTLLTRYVPVLINVDQSPEMVERFQVKGWPTDVIINHEGRELARQVSPQDPREFVKRISTVASKYNAGKNSTRQLSRNENHQTRPNRPQPKTRKKAFRLRRSAALRPSCERALPLPLPPTIMRRALPPE